MADIINETEANITFEHKTRGSDKEIVYFYVENVRVRVEGKAQLEIKVEPIPEEDDRPVATPGRAGG